MVNLQTEQLSLQIEHVCTLGLTYMVTFNDLVLTLVLTEDGGYKLT